MRPDWRANGDDDYGDDHGHEEHLLMVQLNLRRELIGVYWLPAPDKRRGRCRHEDGLDDVRILNLLYQNPAFLLAVSWMRPLRSISSICFSQGSHFSTQSLAPHVGPAQLKHQLRLRPDPGSMRQCAWQWTHISVSPSSSVPAGPVSYTHLTLPTILLV